MTWRPSSQSTATATSKPSVGRMASRTSWRRSMAPKLRSATVRSRGGVVGDGVAGVVTIWGRVYGIGLLEDGGGRMEAGGCVAGRRGGGARVGDVGCWTLEQEAGRRRFGAAAAHQAR